MAIILDLLIIFLLFLIQAAFVLLAAGPLIILKPVRRSKEWYKNYTNLLEPKDAKLPQEDITIETFDGLKLHCWLIAQNKKSKGTIIFLHGVGDCKIAGIPFAQDMYKNGFNVFLFDSRKHGNSDGYYCTYGFYEKHDVSDVITYLQKKKNFNVGKIGLYGTSMGAAIALQTAAIDDRISAVVSEGSFTNLRTIFVDYQKRILKLPWHFLRNMALVQSQKLANFKARNVSPLDDIKKINIPILIVHGEKDTFIKPEYSKMLYDAAKTQNKELYIVNSAHHADVWEVGGKKLANHIVKYFTKYLK